MVSPKFIKGINQYDIVVHDNSGKRNNANPCQQGTERITGNQQTKQHPRGRHHHGKKNQSGLVKAVELSNQQHEHEQQ